MQSCPSSRTLVSMELMPSSLHETGWTCCLISPKSSQLPQHQTIDVTDCAAYHLECTTITALLVVVGPFADMFAAIEFKTGILTNHKPPYNTAMQVWANNRNYNYITMPTLDQLRDLLNPSKSLLTNISPVS